MPLKSKGTGSDLELPRDLTNLRATRATLLAASQRVRLIPWETSVAGGVDEAIEGRMQILRD
eukprot:4476920-Amphidinium_carterae.1